MATKLNSKGVEVEAIRVEGYYTKAEAALLDKAAEKLSEREKRTISRKGFTEFAALGFAAQLLKATNKPAKVLKTAKNTAAKGV